MIKSVHTVHYTIPQYIHTFTQKNTSTTVVRHNLVPTFNFCSILMKFLLARETFIYGEKDVRRYSNSVRTWMLFKRRRVFKRHTNIEQSPLIGCAFQVNEEWVLLSFYFQLNKTIVFRSIESNKCPTGPLHKSIAVFATDKKCITSHNGYGISFFLSDSSVHCYVAVDVHSFGDSTSVSRCRRVRGNDSVFPRKKDKIFVYVLAYNQLSNSIFQDKDNELREQRFLDTCLAPNKLETSECQVLTFDDHL